MARKQVKESEEAMPSVDEIVDAIGIDNEAIEAKVKVVKPPKTPEPIETKPQVPLVTFPVFAATTGTKWDQLAGFKSYVKRNKLGPMSMLDWQAAFKKFLETPV